MPLIILHPVASLWTTWKFHLYPESESYWKHYSLYVSPWLWCFPITHRHKTRIIFMFLFKTKLKVAWRKRHYHSASTGLTLQPLQKKPAAPTTILLLLVPPPKQTDNTLPSSLSLPSTPTLSLYSFPLWQHCQLRRPVWNMLHWCNRWDHQFYPKPFCSLANGWLHFKNNSF